MTLSLYVCLLLSYANALNALRLTLEEVKFLQKQREKKSGIPAIPITAKPGGISNNSASGLIRKGNEKIEGDGEKDDLVLQDTFAQETAVMVEDPNMYVILYILASLFCFTFNISLFVFYPSQAVCLVCNKYRCHIWPEISLG